MSETTIRFGTEIKVESVKGRQTEKKCNRKGTILKTKKVLGKEGRCRPSELS